MQMQLAVCYNNNMSRTSSRPLPRVGSLITLKSYVGQEFVKVESTDTFDVETPVYHETRTFPTGSVAMVLDLISNPDDASITVPLILVDGFKGWIFSDEWAYIVKIK